MSSFIDFEKKYIFVHTPRCAGSSITSNFAPNLSEWDGVRTKRPTARLGRYHWPAAKIRNELPLEFSKYFTFGFVRNPWSRVASIYFHALPRPNHPFHKIASEKNFSTFVRKYVVEEKRDMCHFLCDKDGTILVDHVARFEQLLEELGYLSDLLGTPAAITKENQSAGKLTSHKQMYDQELAEVVQNRFEKDIALFEYSFA